MIKNKKSNLKTANGRRDMEQNERKNNLVWNANSPDLKLEKNSSCGNDAPFIFSN